ncbi:hypothetical protein CBR56_07705 [Bacillus thuringiensis]|uniref:hypothetical protein n=1 Tax=Bacillus tropicus TaxID=2026188 RepID=UPI000B440BD2|nr:hypothetical protein [Bacillus tropicus]MED3037257.1 hypothetical protein [Bacillus tropicus]OTX85111.1 hypothetical protein BK728_10815 [Bacillus thuringiensis serovar chanpaisis]PNK31479.1 hypothetical protein CBR56_07705 [Bacillus thuringiensis]
MSYTQEIYFRMLAVYRETSKSGTTKQLSKVLLALEDFERRYYNTHGFGDLMNLMYEAEERGFLVH